MIWLDFFLRFLLENLIKPLSNHSSLEVSFTTKKILTLLLNCKKKKLQHKQHFNDYLVIFNIHKNSLV